MLGASKFGGSMIIPDTSFQSKIDAGWSLELLMWYYQISEQELSRIIQNIDFRNNPEYAEAAITLEDMGLHEPEVQHVL